MLTREEKEELSTYRKCLKAFDAMFEFREKVAEIDTKEKTLLPYGEMFMPIDESKKTEAVAILKESAELNRKFATEIYPVVDDCIEKGFRFTVPGKR